MRLADALLGWRKADERAAHHPGAAGTASRIGAWPGEPTGPALRDRRAEARAGRREGARGCRAISGDAAAPATPSGGGTRCGRSSWRRRHRRRRICGGGCSGTAPPPARPRIAVRRRSHRRRATQRSGTGPLRTLKTILDPSARPAPGSITTICSHGGVRRLDGARPSMPGQGRLRGRRDSADAFDDARRGRQGLIPP